jgi:hypothetical protein
MYELKATVQSSTQQPVGNWPARSPKAKRKHLFILRPLISTIHFLKTSASLKPTRLPKKFK